MKCNACGKDKFWSMTCIFPRVSFPDGQVMDAIRMAEDRICADCGVLGGGLHHIGCAHELCPRCHERMISCKCGGVRTDKKAEPKQKLRLVLVDEARNEVETPTEEIAGIVMPVPVVDAIRELIEMTLLARESTDGYY